MAPIVTSIEIARPQNDVFAYVTDPSRFAEWQAGVEGGSTEGGTSPHVGAKCTTTRRVGGTARQVTSEITKIDPPRWWGIHGIDGPVRAIVDVTVEALNGGEQSRVTIELDFEGHGIGKAARAPGRAQASAQRDAGKLLQAQATTRKPAKPFSCMTASGHRSAAATSL